MGKLSALFHDNNRHIVTASGSKAIQSVKTSARATWNALKQEARLTFHFRNSIAALAVLVLTSVGVYTIQEKISTTDPIYRVYIDGRYQGVVRDKALLETQMAAYGDKLKAQVDFKPVRQAVRYSNEYAVATAIDESTKTMTDMFIVRVNGADVVYVQDRATAEDLLTKVKQHFAKTTEVANVQLLDRVDLIKFRGDKALITDANAAFHMIVQGKQQIQKYVVSRGDSLWDIAKKNNTTVDNLHAANPEIPNIDAIAEGQQINLNAVQPLISVRSVQESTREITTNYEFEYRDDANLNAGEEKVLQEGVEGKTKQTVKVTYKNGTIEKEEVLKEEVLVAPQKEVVAKGTRKAVATTYSGSSARPAAASGSWAYPIGGGYVSSHYGENRGGKAHLAIDIAAPTGTPVYAANNGTVITAGDAGDGYGYCIRVAHGNGIVTVYAHLSSMNVSIGQAVGKGQKIGGVGSTGWSTGAHLHYEVRVNGVQVNPAPYM